MNWQTATIDDINAYCAKCDPAWDEHGWQIPDCFMPYKHPDYLTLLDGHEELTEYGSRLIRLAIDKNRKQYVFRLWIYNPRGNMVEGAAFDFWRGELLSLSTPIIKVNKDLIRETVCATPRQRLHAACEVLGEQRK